MMKTHKNARLLELLLVEDNPADARYMEEIFRDGRFANRLTTVADGERALRYLRGEGEFAGAVKPDLVLLDLNLPGKNGFNVLEEIRRDPLLYALPVIILTTSSSADDVKLGYELSADAYLVKPPDPARLLLAAMSLGNVGIGLVAPTAGRARGQAGGDHV